MEHDRFRKETDEPDRRELADPSDEDGAGADAKSVPNPHDRFARKMINDPVIAKDLLEHYADPIIAKYVNLDRLKAEPTQMLTKELREFIKDLSFSARWKDDSGKSEVMILVEHKSTSDDFVVLQLYVYSGLSWVKLWKDAGSPRSAAGFKLPFQFLVLLDCGRKPLDESRLRFERIVQNVPPELRSLLPAITIIPVHLRGFDVERLPGGPETRASVESMIRGTDGTFAENLDHILGHFRGMSLSERIQELILDIFFYCNTVEDLTYTQVDRAVSGVFEGMEGKNMTRIAGESIWQTGFEQGISQGISQGIFEGEAKTIIRFLSYRFGEISPSLEERILSIEDLAKLDRLVEIAVSCSSLEQFEKAL